MLQVAVEEIAWACASSALILMVQELGTLPISRFGSDELKDRYLPRCATGEWSPAFCLSEPEAGSNAAALRTTAVRDGDEWVINGRRTGSPTRGSPDFYVVFAVTDREARRMSAFVVDKDTPGLSIGKLEHKLGIRGSPTARRSFEDVRVPAANLIGAEGKGHVGRSWARSSEPAWAPPRRRWASPKAPRTTPTATPRSGSPSASRCTSSRGSSSSWPTCRHARRRRASSSTRPAPWPTAPSPVWASGPPWPSSSPPTPQWRSRIEAVQVLGGYGYVTEYPVERMMRDAKITQIYEGTNEIQRVVIARAMRG
jgi:acyl-CoA dehydrogenase